MWTRIYALDIETSTEPLTADELAAGYVEGSRGLDPRIGQIVAVAVDLGPDNGGSIVLRGPEPLILADLDAILRTSAPGVIATWNGAVFDLPWLADAGRKHGLTLGVHLQSDPAITPKYDPLPGHAGGYTASWTSSTPVAHAHLDIAYAYRALCTSAGIAWGLKPVATHLGLAPVTVDRAAIHQLTGDELDAYVASDAHITRTLASRLLTPGGAA